MLRCAMVLLVGALPALAAAQDQFNPDYEGRVRANEAECRNGVAEACRRLAGWYGLGSVQVLGVRDPDKARHYEQLACDAGDEASCQALAREQLAAAVAGQEARCGGGDGPSCMSLAQAYYQGHQVGHDMARAVAFGDRACTLGQAHGCLFVGAMHERGAGVAQDAARAEDYYRRALALAPGDQEIQAYLRERGIVDR